MNTLFYFSYGSNMSLRRLRQRISDVQMIDIGRLEKHKLEFHKKSNDGSGKCDAYYVGNTGNSVCGIVFEITTSQLLLLDKYEGLGNGYEQKSLQIITQNSGTVCAVTYYATEIDSSVKPYCWYKEHVLQGANEHKLPTDYIKKIKNINAVPDPDIKRHQQELIVYQ